MFPTLILKLYIFIPFFYGVISLTTGKMVPVLARAMEKDNEFEHYFFNL